MTSGRRKLREATAYILDHVRDTVATVPDEQVDRLKRILRSARNVVIFGRGRSGLVGRALAMRLGHLGFHAFVVGETSTPPVRPNDVIVLFSGSGETFSTVLTAEIAAKLGATVVAITSEPESSIAKHANLLIPLVPKEDARKPTLAPLGTLFEDAALLLIDGVVAELMEEEGETEATMQKRHATLE